MRQWLVNPIIMCRQHLLGEHNESHTFEGVLRRRGTITGYLLAGELDPRLLEARHQELVYEMLRRGYNHDSPLIMPPIPYPNLREDCYIDFDRSLEELLDRCPECRKRYELYKECL